MRTKRPRGHGVKTVLPTINSLLPSISFSSLYCKTRPLLWLTCVYKDEERGRRKKKSWRVFSLFLFSASLNFSRVCFLRLISHEPFFHLFSFNDFTSMYKNTYVHVWSKKKLPACEIL